MRLPRAIGDAVGRVLDFCYPGVCLNCAAGSDAGAMLCNDCVGKLDAQVNAIACERCAMPLASHGTPCPYCLGRGVAPYERIIRLGVFGDPLKHLIHEMKYHGRWSLGEYLADRLFATERAKGLLTQTDWLVPVPLHIRRQVWRGYNQADVIARRLASRARIKVVHAGRRTRDTETQTHLHSHQKRLENVRDAFALRRAARKLRGRHVIVVDDVTTSGATLKSFGRVIRQAEPASLCAIVLAIADPRHRGFEAA